MLEVVAAFIQYEDGTFLICRRPSGKARALQWEFPGGKIEAGETPEAALRRECREELDIDVACEGERMALIHVYPDLTVHLHLIACRIIRGTPRLMEHADMRRISLAQAGAYDFCPADRKMLDKMIDQARA